MSQNAICVCVFQREREREGGGRERERAGELENLTKNSKKKLASFGLFTGPVLAIPPEGRPGMSDVSTLSGISGLSFDFTLLSPLLFFCLVLLPFLSYRFLPAGPFF